MLSIPIAAAVVSGGYYVAVLQQLLLRMAKVLGNCAGLFERNIGHTYKKAT